MSMLAARYGARWAFFMREADISLEFARAAPTRALRRLWLDRAWSDLERAGACVAESAEARRFCAN